MIIQKYNERISLLLYLGEFLERKLPSGTTQFNVRLRIRWKKYSNIDMTMSKGYESFVQLKCGVSTFYLTKIHNSFKSDSGFLLDFRDVDNFQTKM